MTSAKDCADFSGAAEGRVLESHLGKLSEPDTLCIFMTRGERRARESVSKAFGNIKRVIIDVDGEKREYDADSLIRLLEGYEDAQGMNNHMRLFGTPERAARTMVDMCEGGTFDDCGGCPAALAECKLGDYDALLEWLRGESE